MTYRGEQDAQRARIEELERKLDTANAEIATLRGARRGASPGTRVEHSRISGGPRRYEREVVLPHAIDELGYEAIATVLRTRLNLNASQVGRTLTVPKVFTLEREGGSTRIRLVGDWRGMPGGVIAASGLAGGFGALMSAGVLADILSHAQVAHQPLVDAGFAGAVVALAGSLALGAGWLTRRGTKRTSSQLLAVYEGTFEAILELADEHAVGVVVQTRVTEDVAAEAEAEPDAEPVSRAHPARQRS